MVVYDYVKKFAKDKVVLDAGTSVGYGAFYLSEAAKLIIGIDIEPARIAEAKNSYQRDNLQYGFAYIELLKIIFCLL